MPKVIPPTIQKISQRNAQKQGSDLRIETITEEDHIRLGTDFDAIIDAGTRELTTHPNSEFLMTNESGPIIPPNPSSKNKQSTQFKVQYPRSNAEIVILNNITYR
ncbi:MAG: hypothetical protein HRU29_12005 [Rhizobiales bacterium]|nr:hypothetical protein [Hyphomicrobiales bacterium]NRB15112.1 hypothetical protein [Hyphomicrobiales bacterium]